MDKVRMKKVTLIWVACILVLVVLYLAATTNLIIKEKTRVVYPVAYFMGDFSEDDYENMKKGMDAATDEYNVDINFISGYNDGSMEDKVKVIKEEIDLGAKAVILRSEDGEEVASGLGNLAKDLPVITLGENSRIENVNTVYVDLEEISMLLVEAILKNHSPRKKVILLASSSPGFDEDSMIKKVSGHLQEEGFSCEVVKWEKEEREKYRRNIVISFNKKISTEFINHICKDGIRREEGAFYAVGSTTFLLKKLDTGVIKGLVAWDEFAMGYVSVEMAVDLIKIPIGLRREKIKSFYLDKEGLNSGEYTKILYPIN